MVTIMLQSPGIYASLYYEVIVIRRVSFFLLILLLMPAVISEAEAASMKAGAVTTASGNLNVRSQASSSSAVVATLRKGSYITLVSRTGSWWKVEYAKNQYGYCHADYVTIVQGTAVTVKTQSGALNVRSGAGTSHGKVASLAKGESVLLLTTANGWSRVLYHGTKTGYVSAQYLSSYYSAVSLSVPSFKQMDSRWAEITIGDSGKTFSQIGCATTAVAMMESYRTGTTINPDKMAQQLKYTAGGNLYWPSHYTTVTNSSGYLNTIYNKLREGKPVLLGARNAYGSQHWVVVTGFQGGSTLSASGFTVLDPGTDHRTNLQQFLNVYPTFYKYFYY